MAAAWIVERAPAALVTHRLHLTEAPTLFARLAAGEMEDAIKVVVTP